MDENARGNKALNILKFSDDHKYKPFLLMLDNGIPLAGVWDRCIAAGLDPSKLLNDCQGPGEDGFIQIKLIVLTPPPPLL